MALRGLLNATANFILSRMNEGSSYEDALPRRKRRAWLSATRLQMSRAMTRWRR